MVDRSDLPGPGEQANPDASLGEAYSDPVPDGDVYHVHAPDDASRQMMPVHLHDPDDSRDSADPKRRTGTDRDGIEAVVLSAHATEQSLDHSADSLVRESMFDPAQDNTGPQSDKC